MKSKIPLEKLSGIWSAAPTPFTARMDVDIDSLERMVEHHVRLGVKGLFLAGTNGEGPWLTEKQKHTMVRSIVKFTRKRLVIAVQVTDNSAARILDNMAAVRDDGADIAVIAPPFFMMNATPRNIANLYLEAVEKSPLPVGIYDRGTYSSVLVPDKVIGEIYAAPNVILAKDSSCKPERRDIALAVRRKKPDLRLLSGYEFDCVSYLKAGYDGLLLGGGVFNGYLASRLMAAFKDGDPALAERLQMRMNRMMWSVYGGRKIKCWLNGEKHLLVEMGIFRTSRTYFNYPLTEGCRKAIRRVLKNEREFLLP